MKILILANCSKGLYGFRRELIEELLHENDVIAYTPDNGSFQDLSSIGCVVHDMTVNRRGMSPKEDIKLLFSYLKILRKEKPDMVICYTIKPNIYGGLACEILHIPYTVNITGLGTAFEKEGLLKKLVIFMYKISLKRARTVFFENSENRDIFIDGNIIRKKQSCLLNGAGVNLERYIVNEYPNDEGINFLFMGRVMKEKGIDELFSAMNRLYREFPNVHLDVLGGFEENYEHKIKQNEKAGWLSYYGYQKDVRPFIAKCHCFVLPSYHEGMANTNLECAASGRPIITSNIPGCKESVIENVSGLLCEPKNEESLYLCMKKIIMLTYEERKAMGEAGRRHMEAVFDKKKVVKKTLKRLWKID